jgi:hypothetical protein
MKKDLRKELNEMKFLFGYKPGKVISEQHMPEMEEDFEIEDLMMAEPGVAEPDVKPDTDTERETKRPFDPSRRERDPGRLPYEDPDTHPQGKYDDMEYELEIDDDPEFNNFSDEENEPFIEDVDSDYENSDLADLVNKYLNKLK